MFQREARGSVTFKIVPSYRSAPPPCEVQVSPKIQLHSQAHTATTNTNTATSSVKHPSAVSPVAGPASSSATGGVAQPSNKSAKTAMKDKATNTKPIKGSKSKSAASGESSTPRRRLNPLAALRSKKT